MRKNVTQDVAGAVFDVSQSTVSRRWHLLRPIIGDVLANLQIAATLDGAVIAVGPAPVHGARHDAHAFSASGLTEIVAGRPTVADLGYVGVDGIDLVPFKKLPDGALDPSQLGFNTALSKMRAAVEHAIAHFKTWRIPSEEGGRYRAPLDKYSSLLKAVIFAAYE